MMVSHQKILSTGLHLPHYKRQPWTDVDDLWLMKSLKNLILYQKLLLLQGWPLHTIIGRNEIDLDSVFTTSTIFDDAGFDQSRPLVRPGTVSQWVAAAVQTFDLLGVPERLAFMLVLGRFISVRYSISADSCNFADRIVAGFALFRDLRTTS